MTQRQTNRKVKLINNGTTAEGKKHVILLPCV
jgi:hypothetical protein